MIIPISSNFNEIDNAHLTPHQGIDFATPLGTPVTAYDDGIIVATTNDDIFGNTVQLRLNDGKIIIYGHLSEIKVKSGQEVNKDELIALTGNTGKSTGAHVHIAMTEF